MIFIALALLESPTSTPTPDARQALDPDGLSPREALEAIYRLNALAG